MRIRDYREEDYPEIEELWKLTGIFTFERGDGASRIESCNRAGGKFLVMQEASHGKIIGTSWLSWDGRRIYLHHFAIHPGYQSRGLGRTLALASIEFARTMDCPVKLEVHRDNIKAVNLYKSLGFESFEGYEVQMLRNPEIQR